MSNTIDTSTCWYNESCVEEMNRFHDAYKDDESVNEHLKVFVKMLEDTGLSNVPLLDIGCGTAMLSKHCKTFLYHGADLQHVIAASAMRNYPRNSYRIMDIHDDDLKWIHQFPVVVMNGFVDVMQNPIEILDKVLSNATEYVIIHRQEISTTLETHVTKNGSYGGETFHSIINRKIFEHLIDRNHFDIVKEYNLNFSNWENGGNSFLLRKRKSWALYDLDYLIYTIFRKPNGIFIEAGANDGLRQSNTMYLEYYKNWTGILVEPVKEVYDELVQNRSAASEKFHALLSNKNRDAETVLYTPENYGLLSVVDDEKAPKMMLRNNGNKPVAKTVPCRTLQSIIDESKFKDAVIDILVLDVEGHELQVLQGIDFDKTRIKYLLIEQLDENDESVFDFLRSRYIQLGRLSEHDYLYVRR